MNNPEIVSTVGTVIKTDNGIAEVEVQLACHDHDNATKVLCGGNCSNKSVVEVKDTLGVHAGDIVQFSTIGNKVLFASFLLYGMPLFILMGGVLAGMELFADSTQTELFSFLLAIGGIVLYYLVIHIFSLNGKIKPELPEIVKVMGQ